MLGADEYAITIRAWETQSLKQVAELTETDWDLYGAIDELSIEPCDALEVPRSSSRMAEDLPLAETYGESSAAFQHYISGLNARLFDNDFEASNAFFDAAVETDPGFVRAWFLNARKYQEAKPEEFEPQLVLGDLLRDNACTALTGSCAKF